MSAEVKVTGQNQEQFLLLAKSAKGAALATLIHQVLEAPGVYVFETGWMTVLVMEDPVHICTFTFDML